MRENLDKLVFADRTLFNQIVAEIQRVTANAVQLCRMNNIPDNAPSMVCGTRK